MQKYTYSPPKVKDSAKLIDVVDEQGSVKCKFKRTYKNSLVRWIAYLGSFDWYAQIDVYSNEGELVYTCKKTTKWVGYPYYQVINYQTNETFQITYKSWQKITPEFDIKGEKIELNMRKEMLDGARVYLHGKEIARWKMKTTEWFKTHVEIEDDAPIQDPEFFISLFQCIFYIGD